MVQKKALAQCSAKEGKKRRWEGRIETIGGESKGEVRLYEGKRERRGRRGGREGRGR